MQNGTQLLQALLQSMFDRLSNVQVFSKTSEVMHIN